MKRRLSKLPISEILEKIEKQVTITQIAKDYGVSREAIYQKLRRDNVQKVKSYVVNDAGSWLRMASAADSLLLKHGLIQAPVDVADIAEREGVSISFGNVKGSELATYKGKSLVISKKAPAYQAKRIIAHEVAKHVLEHERSAFVKPRIRLDQAIATKEDIETMQLATCLLMPYSFLKKAIDKLDNLDEEDIDGLAQLFEVSGVAMTLRLQQANFI